MTTIILSEFEAKGIREGRVGLLVRPILNPFNYTPIRSIMRDGKCEMLYRECSVQAPYHPGTVVGVREAWADACDGDPKKMFDGHWWPKYKSTEPDAPVLKWHSATTMPSWAIRTKLKILSVEAKRVAEVSEEEAELAGYEPTVHRELGTAEISSRDWFGVSWNTRHKKHPFETSWAWFYRVEAMK